MSRTRKRSVNAKHCTWSNSQRLEACKLYIVLGNMADVSRNLGIGYDTLNNWKKHQWWKDMYTTLKAEGDMELSARLRKIAARALDVTEDRLNNGNHQLDQKTGELVRVPVNMKDAAKVATDLMQQQSKIDDKPQQQQLEATIDSRLAALAEKFAAFAGTKKNKVVENVIDAEVVMVS